MPIGESCSCIIPKRIINFVFFLQAFTDAKWDMKEPTHYSYKNRVIPVLWLSFVCKWGVGEVGHLVRDLEVLSCPFPLGTKFCPVEWTK